MSDNQRKELRPFMSRSQALALSLGTSVGWGALVVTANTYLAQAGPMGSVLGLISPVIFSPAFERNGLIRELDQHVWRMAARQVPAVAEGVETHEQLKTLKDLGCQLVQGYYFSRPLPPQEFEAFLQKEADGGWSL